MLTVTSIKSHLQLVSSGEKVKPLFEQPTTKVSLRLVQAKPSAVFAETPNGFIPFSHHHSFVPIAELNALDNELVMIKQALQIKAEGAKFVRFSHIHPDYFFSNGNIHKARQLLSKIRGITHLGIVSEVTNLAHLQGIAEIADIIQLTPQSNDKSLFKQLGRVHKPILLKRGFTTNYKNWLKQAEQILDAGNTDVILCERGTEIFPQQGNQKALDFSAITALREQTHLPIVLYSCDRINFTEPMSQVIEGAINAGISSVIIPVQPDSVEALAPQPQYLSLEEYQILMQQIQEYSSEKETKTMRKQMQNFALKIS